MKAESPLRLLRRYLDRGGEWCKQRAIWKLAHTFVLEGRKKAVPDFAIWIDNHAVPQNRKPRTSCLGRKS